MSDAQPPAPLRESQRPKTKLHANSLPMQAEVVGFSQTDESGNVSACAAMEGGEMILLDLHTFCILLEVDVASEVKRVLV